MRFSSNKFFQILKKKAMMSLSSFEKLFFGCLSRKQVERNALLPKNH